jgi:hypothetical protein
LCRKATSSRSPRSAGSLIFLLVGITWHSPAFFVVRVLLNFSFLFKGRHFIRMLRSARHFLLILHQMFFTSRQRNVSEVNCTGYNHGKNIIAKLQH